MGRAAGLDQSDSRDADVNSVVETGLEEITSGRCDGEDADLALPAQSVVLSMKSCSDGRGLGREDWAVVEEE